MTPAEIQRRVDGFPFWYHRIALPGGVVTPGFSPLNVKAYGVPEDLSGKRVLDVGAWDGYWSFYAELYDPLAATPATRWTRAWV